ncbi:MAG: cytidylate kinase-like family protein [Clostridiales bacterium]|nr:cytidylate kinase-like family protein [Clostridiales bacterium]MDY2656888.1 cytidylate kinase-like family protein [Candidatus Limiplasma sp.]
MDPIITIGREYGSGGREIGKLVADKMGIPFYDKEILTRAAEESGLCHELLERHDEKNTVSGMLAGSAGAGLHMGGGMGLQMPLNQRVFLAQFDAINKIAAEGPSVIVGRCADYVLKDRPGVIHIFIYASEERRIARIMRVEQVDRERARELIRKTDRQRRSYYNFFADGNWGMRSNYDLMIRTDGRRPEDVADAIIAFAKMRADG